MMGTPLADNWARCLDLVDERTEGLRGENAAVCAERDQLREALRKLLYHLPNLSDTVRPYGADDEVGVIMLTATDTLLADVRYAMNVLE